MRFSIIAMVAGAVAVNAAALPEANTYPTTTAKWGEEPKPTTTKWGGEPKPTTTKWGGEPKPTTTKWGGEPKPTTTKGGDKPEPTKTPTCGSGKTPVTCSSVGLLNALNCINLLNGNTISVPISILSDRDVEERSDEGEYCCESAGLLNLLNCVNVANGNEVTIPISILSSL